MRRSATSCRPTRRPGGRGAHPAAQEALRSALGELPDRERKVVELRYGIAGSEPTPARDRPPARITPERVRQIESRALGRLGRMRELAALREAA